MNEIVSFGLFIIVGILWAITFIQSVKLREYFKRKYPQKAQREIPYAFSNTAHPEKIFYFFRKRSYSFFKEDAVLWKLRQKVKFLLLCSILIPILLLIMLALMVLTS
jgi:hypothetical protein